MEVLRFVYEIGFEIFSLCGEINHFKIRYWEINTSVANYLLALVTLEKGLTVDFSHRFNNKFMNGKEFSLKVLESRHSELEFENKF